MKEEPRLWYMRKRWTSKRKHQLKIEPLCKMCLALNKITPATVADHVERHDGNEFKFWFGKLQSLCTDHHNRTKQQIEVRGFSNEIGEDGFPVDKNHPFYKAE